MAFGLGKSKRSGYFCRKNRTGYVCKNCHAKHLLEGVLGIKLAERIERAFHFPCKLL